MCGGLIGGVYREGCFIRGLCAVVGGCGIVGWVGMSSVVGSLVCVMVCEVGIILGPEFVFAI